MYNPSSAGHHCTTCSPLDDALTSHLTVEHPPGSAPDQTSHLNDQCKDIGYIKDVLQ